MKRIFILTFAVLSLLAILTFSVSAEETACTEHTYASQQVTVKPIPTCSQNATDGIVTYTCSVCGATKESSFTVEHEYHSVVLTPASCTEKGVIEHTCNYCGDAYTEELDYVHTYNSVVTTAPSCTKSGKTTHTCTLCDYSYVEETAPHHSYSDLKVLLVPTCFFEGQVSYTCSVCGESVIESVEKSHDYETQITKAATCTENGILRHTCINCNTSHTDVIVAAHDYSKNEIVKIVYTDYTKTGVKYLGCSKCGDVGENDEGIIANPLFIFLGYSIPEINTESTTEGNVEIGCSYTVDIDALQQYLDVMGEGSLEYGVVGAVESHLLIDGTQYPPLNPQTGITNDSLIAGTGFVKKVEFVGDTYSTVDARLANIDEANHPTFFYFCLYAYDSINQKTVYISDDSCRETPLPISYAMLNKSDADHDNVQDSSVELGDLTYSTVEGTKPSEDRLTIIANSANSYKTQTPTEGSTQDEDTVSQIGSIGSWAGTVPNANELLNYYLELGGDATHYRDLDVATLISKVTVAKNSWMLSINNALRASELMAIMGETVNIDQTAETKVQLQNSTGLWSSNRDWYLTFIDGMYYTDTDVDNLTVTEVNGVKTYSATIVYTVIDYYSFLEYLDSDDTSSFLLWGPSKQELAQLHLDGNALDFLIESQISYEVSWTEGQRIGNDGNINEYEAITNAGITETVLSGGIDAIVKEQ